MKLSCTVLSLLATVQSSDVVTNKITDVYHASAMENIAQKRPETKNSEENIKNKKKSDVKISTKKIENNKNRNKNKKSCKINDKTISIVENLINNNSKKSIQPKAQKIASADNTDSTKSTKKSKKIISNNYCNLTDYECTDVLTGDATFYTAKPGKRMSNGELPIAGVHCAMHPKYKDSWAKITFSNGKTKLLKVGDTGGALINGSAVVDIFCDTRNECLQNGRKKVKVEVLKKKKNIHK